MQAIQPLTVLKDFALAEDEDDNIPYFWAQLISAYPDCPMIVSHKILTLRTDLNKLDRDHNMKACDEKYKAMMPEITAQLGGEAPERLFSDMHIEKPFMVGLESIDAAMQEAQEKAAAKIKEMKEKVKFGQLGSLFGKK
jgi:hypothetical protein